MHNTSAHISYQTRSFKDSYLKETPLGRVATPEEVAEAVIFLAANEFANNCVLNLDGGLSASWGVELR